MGSMLHKMTPLPVPYVLAYVLRQTSIKSFRSRIFSQRTISIIFIYSSIHSDEYRLSASKKLRQRNKRNTRILISTMNAFKPTISRLVRSNVAKRWYNPAPKALRADIGYSLKNHALSDPATYPLILILGCAMTFMTGMGVYSLTTYKDVELDPHKRNSTMRTWDTEEVPSMTEKLIYWNSWQKHSPEGLGVDHKKWMEEKKKYMEKKN